MTFATRLLEATTVNRILFSHALRVFYTWFTTDETFFETMLAVKAASSANEHCRLLGLGRIACLSVHLVSPFWLDQRRADSSRWSNVVSNVRSS